MESFFLRDPFLSVPRNSPGSPKKASLNRKMSPIRSYKSEGDGSNAGDWKVGTTVIKLNGKNAGAMCKILRIDSGRVKCVEVATGYEHMIQKKANFYIANVISQGDGANDSESDSGEYDDSSTCSSCGSVIKLEFDDQEHGEDSYRHPLIDLLKNTLIPGFIRCPNCKVRNLENSVICVSCEMKLN